MAPDTGRSIRVDASSRPRERDAPPREQGHILSHGSSPVTPQSLLSRMGSTTQKDLPKGPSNGDPYRTGASTPSRDDDRDGARKRTISGKTTSVEKGLRSA
jgi:hypothetical protein